MAQRNRMATLVVILLFLSFVAWVVYSSFGLNKVQCEVCVEFRGAKACRTAAGRTRQEAIRTATENACAQVASGVTDTIACINTKPTKVSCD